MKKITLFILLLFAYQVNAQNAPIDFEASGNGAAWTWTVFENDANPPVGIIPNPSATGINTSATVASFTALQAGQPYAGCESMHGADIGSFTFTASNSLVKIMVWKPVISDIGIKFVEPSSAALPEIKVANTLINQWEEITFDFSALQNGITYDQIVIFPDFNARAQDNVCYFDNITFNPQGAGPQPGNITLSVDMSEYAPSFTTVYLSGTFNSWCGDCNPMTDLGGGVWEGTVNLPGGDNEYKFTIDNWIDQEIFNGSEVCTTPPGANVNRVVAVDGDATVPAVCFNSCDPCGGGGSAPYVPIDFEPGGNGADWTWTVFENDINPPLEIIGNPDIAGINTSATVAKFTALVLGQPYAGVESMHGADIGAFTLDATNSLIKIMVWKPVISDVGIKLVDNSGAALPEIKVPNTLINQWEELTFDFSAQEGVFTYDQIVIFPDFNARAQDNICYFDNITFNPQGSGDMVTIEFRLNMANETVDPGGVYVAGGGNFGAPGGPGSIQLTDPDGNDIYSGSVTVAQGFSSYFTFANGACGDFNCKENIAGQPCADPANFNDRFIPAVQNDTIIGTCFAQCTIDSICMEPILPGNVTLSVDMTDYANAFTTVFISGTFNAWCGNCDAMTDMGGGVWEGTVNLPGGANEYKFTIDDWTDQEIFNGSESCTTDPGANVNRVVAVDGDVTVPTVCFNSCDACPPANVCGTSNDINALFGAGINLPQTSGIIDNSTNTTTSNDPADGFQCFGEPDGLGGSPSLDNTVWFTFTGDGNEYFIETVMCAADDYIDDGDTQIAIYSGPDCANLTPVACNEDGPNATTGDYRAGLDFATEAGTVYWMIIDGFNLFDGTQISDGEFCVEVTQTTTIDVNEIEFEAGINVYPNPANDYAVLEYSFPETVDLKIEIINSLGQIVRETNEKGIIAGTLPLDIKGLASGIYFITMSDGTNQLTERLIIQKP